MVTLLIPQASSLLEVSLDNATWHNTTYYGLEKTYIEGTLFLQGLQDSTTYYFREKNDTNNWTYMSVRTEEGSMAADFMIVGLLMMFLTSLSIIGTVFIKKYYWKIGLGVASCFLMTGLIRVATLFVEIEHATSTSLIDLLNTFYTISIITTWIVTALAVFAIPLIIVITMFVRKREKEENFFDDED